ncbi:NAD(P)/FAD-dependent oxidoreductase [Fervidobacterium gondwanense]|uniref:NAD(P)/FAD-dependent oxidoreductase n=1 Tax=Fervidobacterium gondwanense TaxID=44754 RepID=UPI003C72981A
MRISIVGAGPAGIACGVLLKRYSIDVRIFEKGKIGGTIRNAWRVENFPPLGFISGESFVKQLEWYVEQYDIEVIYDEILKIEDFKLYGTNGTYSTDIVIVATGTKPRRIPEFEVSSRVLYEYFNLPRDIETVAVYGGGDVALDYAIHALEDGFVPTVFVRGNQLKAVSKLVEYAKERNIHIRLGDAIRRVEEQNGKVIVFSDSGSYVFDALLIAIGRELNMPEIDVSQMKVYTIGDCAHLDLRQSSIAIGDGVKCAMEILRELK